MTTKPIRLEPAVAYRLSLLNERIVSAERALRVAQLEMQHAVQDAGLPQVPFQIHLEGDAMPFAVINALTGMPLTEEVPDEAARASLALVPAEEEAKPEDAQAPG